jgi:hypothetical protein
MPLVNHLRSAHKEQYKEYLVALSNAKKREDKSSSAANQISIVDHFPTVAIAKYNFYKKICEMDCGGQYALKIWRIICL